jgi:predicted nucleotidyltransferase
VEKALIYGSRAKGNFKPGSDVDLTLLGSGLTLKIPGQIRDALEDGLLPYCFDVSIFDQTTQPDLIDPIRRIGVAFYERTPIPVNA